MAEQKDNLFTTKYSRRSFLKGVAGLGLVAAGASALSSCTLPFNKEPFPGPDKWTPPQFPEISTPDIKEEMKEWDTNRLQLELNAAVQRSLEQNGAVVEVILPEGRLIIDKRVDCAVPKGANISLKGSEKGSKLQLDPKLSEVEVDNWDSFAKNTMLFFPDLAGSVNIDGLWVDGGSSRAGKGGYKAPLSPWNAVVFALGQGANEATKNETFEENKVGSRVGKLSVNNCLITNSESEGILGENLSELTVENISGRDLDVLVNSSWCDNFNGRNLFADGCTSDGVYINLNENVDINNCFFRKARQGVDLQGTGRVRLNNICVFDSAIGYVFSKSETGKHAVARNILMNNCHSVGCLMPLVFGDLFFLTINTSYHLQCGEWARYNHPGDFYHHDGIRSPEKFNSLQIPIDDYIHITNIDFKDVKVKISDVAPYYPNLPQISGVTYYQPNE